LRKTTRVVANSAFHACMQQSFAEVNNHYELRIRTVVACAAIIVNRNRENQIKLLLNMHLKLETIELLNTC